MPCLTSLSWFISAPVETDLYLLDLKTRKIYKFILHLGWGYPPWAHILPIRSSLDEKGAPGEIELLRGMTPSSQDGKHGQQPVAFGQIDQVCSRLTPIA